MEFESVKSPAFRGVAVVGDSIADVIGKPVGSYPALVWNVTDQPSGSDVFSAGTDVAHATATAATFTAPGWHAFSVAGANGELMIFNVVVFPANALEVDAVKFSSISEKGANRPRNAPARRNVLRSLAMHATKAGAEAALEGGAATAAALYGTKPSALGAAHNDNYAAFGGW